MNSTFRCAETVRVRSFLRILWCVWTTTVVVHTLLWCGNILVQSEVIPYYTHSIVIFLATTNCFLHVVSTVYMAMWVFSVREIEEKYTNSDRLFLLPALREDEKIPWQVESVVNHLYGSSPRDICWYLIQHFPPIIDR